jgi:zinc transport system substrate-binding protein
MVAGRRARVFATLTSAALALVAVGCGGNDDSAGGDRVHVVASFAPLAEAARQVGGASVEVTDLTPAGAEPHDLELTPGAVDDLEAADLVIAMGDDFQPAVEDLADRRADDETLFVLDALDVDATADDPHVWLDPVLMQEIVGLVADALSRVDPAHASTYTANAEAYAAELAALDREFEQGLAECDRREILTAHDAFGWLARRYDLEQHAIAGIAPDEEPSADRIAELADLAERDGVTTIFTETLVSPRVAQTLAREAGGLRTATLDPLEGLTDDGRDAGAGYLSVMRDNLDALRAALGCS